MSAADRALGTMQSPPVDVVLKILKREKRFHAPVALDQAVKALQERRSYGIAP